MNTFTRACIAVIASCILSIGPIFGKVDESTPEVAKNNVYLELLGMGGMYSINYERLFTENIIFRVGATYIPPVRSTDFYHLGMLPLAFYYTIGGIQNKFELGFGGGFYAGYSSNTAVYVPEWKARSAFFYSIGYRYQPTTSGFMFRISAQLVAAEEKLQPWGGISFGYAF